MLYQKIRPKLFKSFIGNRHIVKSIRSVLAMPVEMIPRCFLFVGPAGCGKTTLAYILAHKLKSRDPYITYLDSAKFRGIDSAKQIAEDSGYRVLEQEFVPKVFIIDECHQLTSHAQKALLGCTEEGPFPCYFIFCTTDSSNMIAPLLTRCTKYKLSRLGATDMLKVLSRGEACLGKDRLPDSIMEAIVESADGCPRTALVLLESVWGMRKDVDRCLAIIKRGREQHTELSELCRLMLLDPSLRRKRWKYIIETLDYLDEEPEAIRRAILRELEAVSLETFEQQEALEIADLITIFSPSCFYSGRAGLRAMVIQACLSKKMTTKKKTNKKVK
jgi:DNA polymerase-3 subunit gamma/tau